MARAIIRTLVSVGVLAGSITFGVSDVRAKHPPSPPPSSPPIDPSRVECTAFQPAKHPHAQKRCYDTANDLFQLFELIFDQLEANDVGNAIQESLPTSPMMFPDGTVVYGPAGFASIAADWAGSNDFTFISVSNTLRYRPLDDDTVVAFGIINFTIQDNEHGTIRTISSAQTELFRRNNQMPRGWEQVYQQLAYVTPLLGDQL
jgi:hypothetical protein